MKLRIVLNSDKEPILYCVIGRAEFVVVEVIETDHPIKALDVFRGAKRSIRDAVELICPDWMPIGPTAEDGYRVAVRESDLEWWHDYFNQNVSTAEKKESDNG